MRADKAKTKQMCHLLRFAWQSTEKCGIDFSRLFERFKCDFCLRDKCITAPYFNYTKALFVLFKPPFPKLLFSDIVLWYVRDFHWWCLSYHLSWILPHCESFKSFSVCICEALFPSIPFFKGFITVLVKSMVPCVTVAQYVLRVCLERFSWYT